jgi:hypothetical protein
MVSRIFASAYTKYICQNINLIRYNKQIMRKKLPPLSSTLFFLSFYIKQDHHLKHPFFPCLRLLICRWGRHSSSVATSSSKLHDTHVHNQELQFSPCSYNHPVKSQKIKKIAIHCMKERRLHFIQYAEYQVIKLYCILEN